MLCVFLYDVEFVWSVIVVWCKFNVIDVNLWLCVSVSLLVSWGYEIFYSFSNLLIVCVWILEGILFK